MAKLAFRALLIAACARVVKTNAFLEAPQKDSREISKDDVQETLQELSAMSSVDLKEVEEELRPMFVALPKGKHGNLEHATARYALHRYFVQKHGWYMHGLDPAGDAWSTPMEPTLMKERAPSYIQELLEERMRGQGLSLHDMAVFAATLTSLVHQESAAELHNIFVTMKLPTGRVVTRTQSDMAVRNHLVTHLLGLGGATSRYRLNFTKLESRLSVLYPPYESTRMWVDDFRRSHDLFAQAVQNPFVAQPETFDSTAAFLQKVGHNFGTFQNLECVALKSTLLDMDHQGTGRVLLRDFYSGFQAKEWLFTESVDYLRSLGAIDETDPKKTSVVIPNYVTSQSNCLTSSGFYSVCCVNECEGLMRRVERDLLAPSAFPDRIVEVVSNLASDTVDAPRNLSSALFGRLQEVASHHGGQVPIYGRLFAQWMHHVYPRECPFPHVSGATAPLSPSRWLKEKNKRALEASKDEMRDYVNMEVDQGLDAMELPWTADEELVVEYVSVSRTPALLRGVLALSVLASVASPLAKAVRAVLKPSGSKDEKCLV